MDKEPFSVADVPNKFGVDAWEPCIGKLQTRRLSSTDRAPTQSAT